MLEYMCSTLWVCAAGSTTGCTGQHSIAQHSKAQHRTAQHRTAQRSTAVQVATYRDLIPGTNGRAIDIVCGIPGNISLQEGNAVSALVGMCGGGAIRCNGPCGGHLCTLKNNGALLVTCGDLLEHKAIGGLAVAAAAFVEAYFGS